jgi:bisphosphoglycerate-dependent phosphoglycerate mutase
LLIFKKHGTSWWNQLKNISRLLNLRKIMNITNLPKEKNITEFTDEELLLWLKDYIGGWASDGVAPQAHYEAVKTELMRRNNERTLSLTKKIHNLTAVLVFLTIVIILLTLVLIFR